jgi:hypothetical protein
MAANTVTQTVTHSDISVDVVEGVSDSLVSDVDNALSPRDGVNQDSPTAQEGVAIRTDMNDSNFHTAYAMLSDEKNIAKDCIDSLRNKLEELLGVYNVNDFRNLEFSDMCQLSEYLKPAKRKTFLSLVQSLVIDTSNSDKKSGHNNAILLHIMLEKMTNGNNGDVRHSGISEIQHGQYLYEVHSYNYY